MGLLPAIGVSFEGGSRVMGPGDMWSSLVCRVNEGERLSVGLDATSIVWWTVDIARNDAWTLIVSSYIWEGLLRGGWMLGETSKMLRSG